MPAERNIAERIADRVIQQIEETLFTRISMALEKKMADEFQSLKESLEEDLRQIILRQEQDSWVNSSAEIPTLGGGNDLLTRDELDDLIRREGL